MTAGATGQHTYEGAGMAGWSPVWRNDAARQVEAGKESFKEKRDISVAQYSHNLFVHVSLKSLCDEILSEWRLLTPPANK